MSKFFLLLIIGLYFITRFFNLNSLPIFNDEAIYLHWGQIMVNVPGQAFYSLFDGKPPLVLWLYGLAQKFFSDPLVAGRAVTIMFGLLTFWGIIKTCQLLNFSPKTQILAALFYITNPLVLFFDRMAILDSPVSTVFIWVLYLSLDISRRSDLVPGRTSSGMLLAILLGTTETIGLWIKGTAQFFLFLPFLIPLITFAIEKNLKKALREAGFFTISFFVAQIFFLPVRFQQLFNQFSKREGDFLLPLSQWFQFQTWFSHLSLLTLTSFIYITPLVLILAIFGFFKLAKKDFKISLIILLFFLLPLLAEIITAKYFLSRYFLFTLIPIFIFSAVGLEIFKAQKSALFLTSLIPISISLSLIFSPLSTLKTLSFNQLLKSDLYGYVTSWPSGYGVKDAALWLNDESQKGPIVVIVRADSGNPEDAMFVYLAKNKNIIFAQTNRKPTKEELAPLAKFPIYFVSRGPQLLDMGGKLEERIIFKKPLDPEFVGIYQIKN